MMNRLVSQVRNLVKSEKGQGMVEYGLIIALVAVVVIGALTLLGGNIGDIFDTIAGKIVSPTP